MTRPDFPARPPAEAETLPDSAGEVRRAEDRIDPARLAELHAALDRPGEPPAPGAPLPPLWHAPFFHAALRPSELAEDGGPAPDGLLPETGLPRRRRGGGRLEFLAPLAVGAEATRLSALQNVALKQGGEAPLALITLRHEISGPEGLAIREEADLVFRPALHADEPPPPKPPLRDDRPAFEREARLDPVTVQRFCGLTGDSHRIHWDADFARATEGLPGPVAPSAMLALMLADLLRDNVRRPIRNLEWRVAAHPPTSSLLRFRGRSFGPSAELWIVDEESRLVLEARAALG